MSNKRLGRPKAPFFLIFLDEFFNNLLKIVVNKKQSWEPVNSTIESGKVLLPYSHWIQGSAFPCWCFSIMLPSWILESSPSQPYLGMQSPARGGRQSPRHSHSSLSPVQFPQESDPMLCNVLNQSRTWVLAGWGQYTAGRVTIPIQWLDCDRFLSEKRSLLIFCCRTASPKILSEVGEL